MKLFLAAVLLLLGTLATAQTSKNTGFEARFEARVMRVVDGATLVVRKADKTEQTVRLRHIDAPQLCQPGGPESQQALVNLALGNDVQVRPMGRNQTVPLVAAVGVLVSATDASGEASTSDLSRRQVEQGHAVSVLLRHDTGPLVKEERMAKALGRGLHASGGAQAVRDFKRRGGRCP
jgi:endonuclease YncB( thermonuclease family)